ncbi:MAG: rhamnose transport system permease protein [Trebonia sp.]|nr:inner-rane translocator [Actinomycetes bacterium]MDX6421050.1 rhamnose transport system permease protein [Trebonia sp.]
MTAPAAPMTPVQAPGIPRMARFLRAREAGTLALVLLVFLLTTLKNHNFASSGSIQQLLVGASLIALLGVGETMVIVTRNIDLSVGSTLGLSAFVVGDLFRTQHIPVWSGFVIAIAIGAVVGVVNGAITTLVRVPSLVVTLAMLYIIRGLDSKLVNGSIVVPSQVPHAFIEVGYRTLFGIPWLAIIVAVVVAVVGYVMRTFRPARELYAIGSNPDAAALAGIPSARRVFVAFVTSGALAGLGGALFLALFAQVDNSAGLGYELNIVAAAVVGGVAIFGGSGTVVGAALGALLLNTIQQGLVAVRSSSFWDEAIAGGLLLAAIAIDRWLSLRVARSLRSAEGAHREL